MRYLSRLAILACVLVPAAAFAQHEGHGAAAADKVGSTSVNFQTSCAPGQRADFNRAVALLHSFWFAEAITTFNGVLAADPSCAIAHWGIALSQWGNPFAGLRAPQQIELGRAAILKAQATGSPTPRERAYIEAAAALFTDGAAATQRARVTAYADLMEKVARTYPDDVEGQIFYALAVNQTARPEDKTYAAQLKAASVLEPLFKQHPSHPGLAHYIIHAYDHPPLAPKALDAARRYASLAPAVPHALHMPSHTFTRLGYWTESIETNRRSAEAASKSSTAGEELHALDYQAYAYLQTAQDAAAKTVLDRTLKLTEGADGISVGAAGAGAFAIAAIPARYAIERGAWNEAATLTVRPAKTPYTEAMTHFARALGAARSGNPKAAAADIDRLAALTRSADVDAGYVLGGTGGHPTPHRSGLGRIQRGAESGRYRGVARSGRCRRCDGQVGRLAGTAGTGARAAGVHAARRRPRRRGAGRVRSESREGAESFPRSLRSGPGGRGGRRSRESRALLPAAIEDGTWRCEQPAAGIAARENVRRPQELRADVYLPAVLRLWATTAAVTPLRMASVTIAAFLFVLAILLTA